LGFDEVVEKTDLTMRQMRVEVDRFSATLQQGAAFWGTCEILEWKGRPPESGDAPS
jgi:hypothetical protein